MPVEVIASRRSLGSASVWGANAHPQYLQAGASIKTSSLQSGHTFNERLRSENGKSRWAFCVRNAFDRPERRSRIKTRSAIANRPRTAGAVATTTAILAPDIMNVG